MIRIKVLSGSQEALLDAIPNSPLPEEIVGDGYIGFYHWPGWEDSLLEASEVCTFVAFSNLVRSEYLMLYKRGVVYTTKRQYAYDVSVFPKEIVDIIVGIDLGSDYLFLTGVEYSGIEE